jgi:lipopolysaccharide export system protein LptA
MTGRDGGRRPRAVGGRWHVVAWMLALAVPLVSLLAPVPTSADGIDMTHGGPIDITAKNGIDWREAEHVVVARGDASAVRGDTTVTADRLLAWYRPKAPAAGQSQPPTHQTPASVSLSPTPTSPNPPVGRTATPPSEGVAGVEGEEGNEVYRLRAEGHVHIYTRTDQAWGDQATYDLDHSVLVMTGHDLRLTTPTDTLTARDTLEYWTERHMAVARGDAVVVTNDGRRISADTLVAYTSGEAPRAPGTTKLAEGAAPKTGGGDPLAAMAGRLERVEAFGDVTVRTVADIVTGDRAVYIPETGIAHIGGHVRITRGPNQLNGSDAVVNMKTGVATLLAGDTGRVSGLVLPNDKEAGVPGDSSDAPKPSHAGRAR